MKESVWQRTEECQRDIEREGDESENEDDKIDDDDEDSGYEVEVLEEGEGFETGKNDSDGL